MYASDFVPLTSFYPGYIFDHVCVSCYCHYSFALHRPDSGRLVIGARENPAEINKRTFRVIQYVTLQL